MDVIAHNRQSWNAQSRSGQSEWCRPVSREEVDRARKGDWNVILTPNKPVPKSWFGALDDADLLCLASGGGQQAPILAAAGARVTSFDLSDAQLALDAEVAQREGLPIETLQGDMADLSCFADESFDLIFHSVSNVFAPDPAKVWRECARVLRPGGRLLAGFMNPAFFLFDHEALDQGAQPIAVNALPYADIDHLNSPQVKALLARGEALEYSHSLEVQIGGQLAAGLVLTGLYEDDWSDEATPLNRLMPSSIATLAIKGGAQ
jgi:SAM-dependent methyltransferase